MFILAAFTARSDSLTAAAVVVLSPLFLFFFVVVVGAITVYANAKTACYMNKGN